MATLFELMQNQPMMPYIRESDYAIRVPWTLGERRLLDYLLIYVQEGHCRFTVDGVAYDFQEGELCLIQPNSVHMLEGLTSTITPFAHLDLFYNPKRAESFPTKAGQLDLSPYQELMQPRLNNIDGLEIPVKINPPNKTAFRDKLLSMVRCWQDHDDPVQQLRAQSLALALAVAILEAYGPSGKEGGTPPHTLNWVTSYMSFRLSDKIHVSDMARRAHLSPSRFNVVFRENFGKSPHQYLLELRLNHAAELLQNGVTTMADIAAYCGFADIHHFAKSFKSRFGVAPGAYREEKKV